jgi:exodeoxyribonuclease-3
MRLVISTWNINSVRLRLDLVGKFIKAVRPDVLCLQETKCPDDRFPLKPFRRLGYEHAALNGQKGYHGVAILSRLPFETTSVKHYCGKTDSRHIGVVLGEKAGLRDPVMLHNYYVPAGGDEPDPALNPKFAHKLDFLDELGVCPHLNPAKGARAIVVGDLNIAPLEHDVWNHKALLRVVSHTPIECAHLRAGTGQALHLVELPLARLGRRRPGPSSRPHLGFANAGRPCRLDQDQQGGARLEPAFRPRPGDRGLRALN